MSDFLTAFSDDYFEARDKFLFAARVAGAKVKSVAHPLPAPNGETIHMDIAEYGPDDAQTGVLIVAGVHGRKPTVVPAFKYKCYAHRNHGKICRCETDLCPRP